MIYKSISGIRSIVQKVTKHDSIGSTGSAGSGQFQRLVEGQDIRAHVIGRTVIATAISSAGVDYRYAARESAHRRTRGRDLEPAW